MSEEIAEYAEYAEYVEAETVPFLDGWIDLPRYRRRTPAAPSEAVERHRATFVREWRDESSDAVPVAAPSVPSRDASSDEMPTGARRIADLARANGWRVREVYSRGPVRAGRPAVKAGNELSDEPSDDIDGAEVVTVRCLLGACAPARTASGDLPSDAKWAVACYRNPGAGWDFAWGLIADRSDGLRKVTHPKLKKYLRGEESSDEAPAA